MKTYGIRYTGLIAVATAATLSLAPLSAAPQAGSGQGQAAQQTQPQTRPTMTAVTVKAADIAADPEKHYNKRVTVTASVDEVIGMQTFTLDDETAAPGPDLLVISPALAAPVTDNAMLTVTGTLKPFVEADIKRDYAAWNWFGDWKTELSAQFKDKPVLLADSIKTRDGKELIKK
jgi:hypothetical protein